MSKGPIYLQEKEVLNLLSWDSLIPAMENVLCDISHVVETQSIQPSRLIMPIPPKQGAVLCMPSFSGKQNILGCKIVSSFRNNVDKGLPSIFGTILLMDSETGKVKMILEGTEITAWRTAAASVVATKHVHCGKKNVLAILGAGVQGRSHALALHHYFKFPEVRIWNRTHEKAEVLCQELGPWAKAYESNEACVHGADVVVTATYASEPIVKAEWLTNGTHINAVGFGVNHHNELSMELYRQSTIITDSMPAAQNELKGLVEAGVDLHCELGEVIRGVKTLPNGKAFTIFHSLGMSLEDVIASELIYKRFMEKQL